MPQLSASLDARAAASRATAPSGARTARWRGVLLGLGVFAAGWAVFGRTVGHEFVKFDDPFNVELNENIRGLGAAQLRWMFTAFHMGHYHPLTWLSLACDYRIGQVLFGDGLRPATYHFTNTLLHAGSMVLAYHLARRLLGRSRAVPWHLELAAVLTALLFGLHPLRVESVAWVTERRDVLSSFLLLATMLLYLRSCESAATFNRWWFLALLMYAGSLLSRAIGVTLPVILLLLDWYPLGRLGSLPDVGSNWRVLGEKLPLFILGGACAVVAPLAQQAAGATPTLETHGLIERIAQACYGLVFYLWKTAVPLRLSPIYEIKLPIDVTKPRYVAAAALVVAGLIVTGWLVLRRRGRPLVVAAGAYVLLLLPVLGLFQSGIQEAADRYTYLPGVVIAVLAGAGVLRVLRWRGLGPCGAGLVLGVGSAAVLVLAGLTWLQCAVWADSASLFTHACRVSPASSTAQNGYGWVLLEQGRPVDAERHLRRALEIQPLNEYAHRNLWRALEERGKTGELIAACRDALRHRPRFVDAHVKLAELFERQRDLEGAINRLAAAVAVQPDDSELRRRLSRALWLDGRTVEAAAQLGAAMRSDPHNPTSRQMATEWMVLLGNRARRAGWP